MALISRNYTNISNLKYVMGEEVAKFANENVKISY